MSAVKRIVPIILLALLSVLAVMYAFGMYDFTFIERDRQISAPETDGDTMDSEDKENEDKLGHMDIGDNISDIGKNDDTDVTDETDGTGAEETKPDVTVPDKKPDEEYIPYDRLASAGFSVTDKSFVHNGRYVLIGELTLPEEISRDHVKGTKNVTADAPKIYEDGGEYFYNTEEKSEYRFTVETYMGYIIVSEDTYANIYSSDGVFVSSLGFSECKPAFLRDENGSPLFYDDENRLFYITDGGRKVLSEKQRDIGLYYDSRASLGVGDNGLSAVSEMCEVSFHDEIDTSDYYVLSSVDPSLAEAIYKSDPAYAARVARNNPRFAEALEKAKKEIAEAEKARLTETAPVTKAPEPETTAPSASESTRETEISDTAETEKTPETETETKAEQVTATETETETEKETEAVTATETETETETEKETNPETETETPETTMPEPEELPSVNVTRSGKNLIIDRKLLLPRYAYAFSDTDSDLLVYKYAKAYNYSEGRAAVVDDKGVLRYIDGAGNVVIDGTGTKMVTSSRYVTTEYALPSHRNSDTAKGYIYFDNGLVRVRKLERDYTFRNLIYSDSDVLLYPDGSEFAVPQGYTLEAYSEGVLVLRGRNGKFGYYHKDGYWLAKPVYTFIKPFSEGLGVLGFEGGKKGVIDTTGSIVVPFAYEYITAPSCGVITLYDYEIGWRILVKAGI